MEDSTSLFFHKTRTQCCFWWGDFTSLWSSCSLGSVDEPTKPAVDIVRLFGSARGHGWALFDAVKHPVWALGAEAVSQCRSPPAPDLLLQQWEGRGQMQTHSAGSRFCSYDPCHDFSFDVGNLKATPVYLDLFPKAQSAGRSI